MKIRFLDRFGKDLDKLRDRKIKGQVVELIATIEGANLLEDVSNVNKMVGHHRHFEFDLVITGWVFLWIRKRLFLSGCYTGRIFTKCSRKRRRILTPLFLHHPLHGCAFGGLDFDVIEAGW